MKIKNYSQASLTLRSEVQTTSKLKSKPNSLCELVRFDSKLLRYRFLEKVKFTCHLGFFDLKF